MLRSALAGGVASFLTTFVLQGLSSEQNMKTLKVTVVLIVVIVGLTLATFRVTGLEPEYLDLDQLRAHHMIARPGLWLKGEVVTTPITDWSFVDKVEHPGR